MWQKMMKLDLVKLKTAKDRAKDKDQCSSSRIENKKIGHFHSLDKENIPTSQSKLRTQPSPQPQKPYNLQTEADEQPDNRSTRILYTYTPAMPTTDWSSKAIHYKNQLQSYKTKLYAAEYQLRVLEERNGGMMEGERMRYERRIDELKGRLAERDKEIREKDQIIKGFIGITRQL